MPAKLSTVKSFSLFDVARPVYTIEMSFDDFAVIERCPIQRDESLRTNKAQFDVYSPTHNCVAIAVLPSGKIYKLNGHSRVAAVEEGKLSELKTAIMQVSVYSVQTVAQAERLYHQFDNTNCAKTASDTVQSGFASAGLRINTGWIAAGRIGSSLSMAAKIWLQAFPGSKSVSRMTQIDKVALFQREIALFDSIEPNKGRFLQGNTAAALLAFKKHGAGALDFFQAYNDTEGLTNGSARNAVRMLHEYMNSMRLAGRTAGGGVNDDQFARTLALFNRHVSSPSEFRTNQPTPVRPIDFARM